MKVHLWSADFITVYNLSLLTERLAGESVILTSDNSNIRLETAHTKNNHTVYSRCGKIPFNITGEYMVIYVDH